MSADDTNVPDWLYRLFTGNSYPYLKRQAKFSLKREATPDVLRELFVDIFPRCTMKVLLEEKQGMIVAFRELGERIEDVIARADREMYIDKRKHLRPADSP